MDIRDSVVGYVERMQLHAGIPARVLLTWIGVAPSKYYTWVERCGRINNHNTGAAKSHGFEQPGQVHEHWHVDITYVNFPGTFLFLISVFAGFSRYNLHHELRLSMQEFDVQLTIERALEKFPQARPRIISDNRSQFVAKDCRVPSRPRSGTCADVSGPSAEQRKVGALPQNAQ